MVNVHTYSYISNFEHKVTQKYILYLESEEAV
jgi:hypothetical protein